MRALICTGRRQYGTRPGLAVVIVGSRKDSQVRSHTTKQSKQPPTPRPLSRRRNSPATRHTATAAAAGSLHAPPPPCRRRERFSPPAGLFAGAGASARVTIRTIIIITPRWRGPRRRETGSACRARGAPGRAAERLRRRRARRIQDAAHDWKNHAIRKIVCAAHPMWPSHTYGVVNLPLPPNLPPQPTPENARVKEAQAPARSAAATI